MVPCFRNLWTGRHSSWQRWSVLLVLGACGGMTLAADDRQAEHQRVLDALCQQGQFAQAVDYCRRQLAEADLGERLQAFFVIERSRCQLRQAMSAAAADSDSQWDQSTSGVDQFIRDHPRHPRLLLLKTQAALARLAHGEWLADQMAEMPGSDTDSRQAQSLLRQATTHLADLSQETTNELRKRHPARPTDERLRPHELGALAGQLQYQQARAYRALALLAEAGTPDRTDALNQAIALLRSLALRPTDQPLAWQSRLDLLTSLRALFDYEQAGKLSAEFEKESPPTEIEFQLRAEALRLASAAGDKDRAEALFRQGREIDDKTAPALDEALLEAAVAMAGQADGERNAWWQEQAQSLAKTIERDNGPAWADRAKRRLAVLVRGASRIDDLELLEQAAQTERAAGHIDAAIAAFDRASEQADKESQPQRAFEFSFYAATLEHERKQLGAAAERYRQLAETWPKHERAAEVHLLAAHDRLEELRSSGARDFGPYTDILREHLTQWPQGDSANEARWRLGRIAEHQQQWLTAIDAYRSVEPTHVRAEDAVRSTLRCYERQLAKQIDQGQDVTGFVTEGARYFERMGASPGARKTALRPELRHASILAASQMWRRVPGGAIEAGRVVSDYLADPNLTPTQREEARHGWLLAGLAEGGDTLAVEQTQQLAALTPLQLYGCQADLVGDLTNVTAEQRLAVSQGMLRVSEKLRPGLARLTAAQQRNALLWEAAALATVDRRSEAQDKFVAVKRKYPDDPRVAEEYAEFLSADKNATTRSLALDQWRRVEHLSKADTPTWHRARYQMARLYHALGDDAEAAKIIRATRVAHPDLGGSTMQARYEALEKELRAE